MINFVIIGHANIASGLLSAVELILGPQKQIQCVELLVDDTLTEFKSKLKRCLSQANSNHPYLVFCDLLGGSPFQVAATEALQSDFIQIVYGINLGMLIEMISLRDSEYEIKDMVDAAVRTGINQVGYLDKEKVFSTISDTTLDEDW